MVWVCEASGEALRSSGRGRPIGLACRTRGRYFNLDRPREMMDAVSAFSGIWRRGGGDWTRVADEEEVDSLEGGREERDGGGGHLLKVMRVVGCRFSISRPSFTTPSL